MNKFRIVTVTVQSKAVKKGSNLENKFDFRYERMLSYFIQPNDVNDEM